jgi:hypothetical protein
MVGMDLAMNSDLKEEAKIYLKNKYGKNIAIKNFENKNLTFDITISHKNIALFIEYKQRFFYSDVNMWALNKNDILIELVQTLPYFQFPHDIKFLNNKNINSFFNSKKINTAIGWFYKCLADRLIYFRYLDDKLADVFDIDFSNFKRWVMNNIENFMLQYSDKTTGTINLKVPLFEIPAPFILYTSYQKKDDEIF